MINIFNLAISLKPLNCYAYANMSWVLSELLEAPEPLFSQTVHELELASGSRGIDVKLSTELDQNYQLKARELGLDQHDTHGQELYHALQALTEKHDLFLARSLGIKDPHNVAETLTKIKAKVDKLDIPMTCWAIKHSVAKKLLKQTPPKKVMKLLGYRSVDSMLKRENIDELFGSLRFVESDQWLIRFVKTYKKLQPQDFETRKIKIIELPEKRWGIKANEYVRSKRLNITHLKEMGVVVLLPMPVSKLRGVCLAVLLLTLHYIDEIRTYSALFKLEQVRPDFAANLINTLINDPSDSFSLLGRPVHWRILKKHFGRSRVGYLPEVFEPHIQVDDMLWRRAEEVLYKIEPALKFWESMEYSGVSYGGKPVSFNLMDNAVNYCNNLDYSERVTHHLQNSLWNELLTRYISHKDLEDMLLQQLDQGQTKYGILTSLNGGKI